MVTISHPTNIFPIQMPTPDEMAGLLAISRSCLFPGAPSLSYRDRREFFSGFVAAFQYTSTLRRTDELKDRADLWIDRARHWAHERQGEQADIGLSAFMCAIAAAGDVAFRLDLARWPFDIFVGLSWTAPPAATDAWRTVLASKEIRASVPLPKSPYPTAHPLIYAS
jgi:hypothetical protein